MLWKKIHRIWYSIRYRAKEVAVTRSYNSSAYRTPRNSTEKRKYVRPTRDFADCTALQYRGYADTPILHACTAYAAILGGKSARVARLSNGIPRRKYSEYYRQFGMNGKGATMKLRYTTDPYTFDPRPGM